jgi:homoserine kinase type II
VEIIEWNLGELRREWPVPEPWSLRSITHGINNLTHLVNTSAGNYILRAYASDRSLDSIRYELSVLTILQKKNLPFQIPAPIPTATGKLFAVLSGTIVTLSTWLSGSTPQGDNLEQAYAAGQALAELGKALADIQVDTTGQIEPFPLSGDFEDWAGIAAASVNFMIQELPLKEKEQEEIITLLEKTQALAPFLYRTLPQQVIHRDYDQSNILMEGNSVTGVLDFEFSGPDLRILDLAYALSQWPSGLWHTGKEWSVIDAFAQGYLQRQMVTFDELEMLPLIFRLRATTSLFFRLGRYTRGLQTSESTLEHIHEALNNEFWLRVHEAELLSHVHNWYH